MRAIRFLVIHCTATRQDATIKAIQDYWKNTLGWKNPGYHIIIDAAGIPHRLATDSQVCNGVSGHNSNSVHVSYIGGVDASGKAIDNRTPQQKQTLLNLLKEWRKLYPNAVIQGHRDFAGVRKDCPSFNAKAEYAGV
jgi:N-acetylmuramoyl-L-alanine amidase